MLHNTSTYLRAYKALILQEIDLKMIYDLDY